MAPELAAHGRMRVIFAFAAVYLIWGSTYLAILFAIQSIPPLLMAGVRITVAGAVLYLWARLRGDPAPRRGQWAWALLLGGLFFLMGNGMVVWVEQWMPSGLTALIVAMVSVWTAILEWARPGGVRPSGMILVGIVLGFLGVALLVLPSGGGAAQADTIGVLLLMGSTFGWSLASVLSRTADLPASIPVVSGMEMLAGGGLLLVAGLLMGEWHRFSLAAITHKSLLSLLYLILFGSLLAFTCFAWLLKVTSPNKVATSAYVNPMVAVFLGWAFAGETLTTRSLVASAVIVASVVLIITGKEIAVAHRKPAAVAAPAEARPADRRPAGAGTRS